MPQPDFRGQMNQVGIVALSLGAEHVPHLSLDTGGITESMALSPGERVSRSGAFTSRSGTGEGSLARFASSGELSAAASFRTGSGEDEQEGRMSVNRQCSSHREPRFPEETGGESLPRGSGRATSTLPRSGASVGWADRTGRLKRMRSFSRATELADGSNPSPVRRRLVKAPSPDTLSPRERAIFPPLAPPVPSRRYG